jgi:hypothetical protein
VRFRESIARGRRRNVDLGRLNAPAEVRPVFDTFPASDAPCPRVSDKSGGGVTILGSRVDLGSLPQKRGPAPLDRPAPGCITFFEVQLSAAADCFLCPAAVQGGLFC